MINGVNHHDVHPDTRTGDHACRRASRPRIDEAPPRQRRAHVALPARRVVLRPVRRARPVRGRRGRHRVARPVAGHQRRPRRTPPRSSSAAYAWSVGIGPTRASSPGRSATSPATGPSHDAMAACDPPRRPSRGRSTTRAGSAATSTPPAPVTRHRLPDVHVGRTDRAWSREGRRRAPSVDPLRVQPRDGAGRRPRRLLGGLRRRGRSAGRVRVGVGRPRTAPHRRRRLDVVRLRRRLRRGAARRVLRVRRPGVARSRCRIPCWPSWRHSAEPVVVRATTRGGRLTIENRRWFTGVDDLEARGRVGSRRPVVARGRLALPAIGHGHRSTCANPAGRRGERGDGRHTMTIEVVLRPRRGPSWAPPGWVAATSCVELGGTSGSSPAPKRPVGSRLVPTAWRSGRSRSAGRSCRCGGRRPTTTTHRATGA